MIRKRPALPRRRTRKLLVQSLEVRQLLAADSGFELPADTTAALVAGHSTAVRPGEIISFQATNSAPKITETAYRLRSSQGEWYTARDYASDGQWDWNTTGLPADTYYVGTFVRAVGATTAYQAAATPLTFVVSRSQVASGATISVSKSHATIGDALRLTASGQGGSGNYEFAFRARSANGQWKTLRDYDSSPTWDWDTSGSPADLYYVGVYVRDAGSPALMDAAATPVSIHLAGARPLEGLKLQATVNAPSLPGPAIRFEAEADDGGNPEGYEYAFQMRSSTSDWQVVQAYSQDTDWVWTTETAAAGEYYIGVLARRVGSQASYEWAATPLTQHLIAQPVVTPERPGNRPFESYSTILVATCDSSAAAKQTAQFVADCSADQAEINAAIAALPPVGGTIRLAEGTYDIQAVEGTLGGVLIDRSNVVLEGSGNSTKLRLADDQNTNVIRIIGDGLSNITIRNLYINGNFDKNYSPVFEANGIKAESSTATPMRSITVEHTFIEDSARLNVFLKAVNARIQNNQFGDSGSDSVEILTGPGFISNNYFEIDRETGYVISTDQANDVTITNNIIQILPSGSISQSVIRTWGGRYSHIISNNQIRAHGAVNCMLEVNGYINVIEGNIFLNYNAKSHAVVNGASLVHDNIFHNMDLVVKPTTFLSSSVANNLLLFGSQIRHEPPKGSLAELRLSNNVSTP